MNPAPSPEPSQGEPVPRGEAFAFWLRLGFISFGGPAGQIAIMHRELVERRRWISEQRFLHALNYCMLLPGPEAQQLATYLGWLMHRTLGGLVAGLLFILPSMVLLVGLSYLYMVYGQQPWAAAILYGLKAAVVALVLHALWRLGRRCLGRRVLPWALCIGAFVALAVLRWPFPWLIGTALLFGLAAARWAPDALAQAAAAAPTVAGLAQPALIDDHSPTPAHAQPRWSRLLRVLLVALFLGLLPLAALVSHMGWEATLTQMALFFAQAAFLTFGGAYAVLPYVQQAAVEQYQWLSTAQMMDALALGESTPGPLIMVVAFVAFVGGWTHQVLGPEALPAAGVLAAVVACWFTFLPSFVFILAGGPWVEASRARLGWTVPLQAITCAVIGVIAHLGWTFAHTLAWPAGPQGPLDGTALVLLAFALWALWRAQWGALPLLAACAGLGLAASWLGLS